MDRTGRFLTHEVTQAVKDRLQRSPYTSVRRLKCEYDDGVLVLRGRLPSFCQKQLAQEAVVGLPGVFQVVNATEVVGSIT